MVLRFRFLSYIGYKIKPQTMIVAIAIMLITILNIKLSCIGRGYLKKSGSSYLGILISIRNFNSRSEKPEYTA